MLPAGYHIQKPFVITFSKIYDTIGVSASPFICLCLCICLCICICICICLCIWIFVRIWIADIISFQKIYGLRGTWGLTAVLQLIYELRKNCCGRVDGTGKLKVLQEVLADLKTAELVYLGIPYLKNNKTGRTLLGQYCVKKFIVSWNPFSCTFRPSFLLCGCHPENNWLKSQGEGRPCPCVALCTFIG